MQNKKLWLGVALALVLAGAAGGVWFYMQPSKPIRSTVKPRPVQVPAPKEQAQPKPTASDAKGVAVAPITQFSPGTVYSGTLGEVTGLQAGRDINKAAFEFKQMEVKVKEMEEKLTEKPTVLPTLSLPPLQPSTAPEAKTATNPRLVVQAVRGMGNDLTATLRTKDGTYLVKAGDTIPGHGKVQLVTRERVIVNHAALPWM